MATFLQAADRMPSISGSSEKDVKALHDYVYSLQEALRYVLGNLGEENLDSELLESIKQSGKFASEIRQKSDEIELRVEELGGSVSTLSIRADGLDTRVATAQSTANSAISSASYISQRVDNIVLGVETDEGTGKNFVYIRIGDEKVEIGKNGEVTHIDGSTVTTTELVANRIKGNQVQIYDDNNAYYGVIEAVENEMHRKALEIFGYNGLRLFSNYNIFLCAGYADDEKPTMTFDYENEEISIWAAGGLLVNGKKVLTE